MARGGETSSGICRAAAPATELALGEYPAPAMQPRQDRGIVPGNRVGLSDQADFANEEVSMSPQTTPAELPVGHLGFGAMRITGQGIWGPPKDESEAIALLRRVVDRGVTFIDTADSYGPGISETLIAKALGRSRPSESSAWMRSL